MFFLAPSFSENTFFIKVLVTNISGRISSYVRVKALPRNAKSKIGPDGGYDSVDFGHSEVIRTLPDVFRAKEFSPHMGRLLSNRHLG